MCKRRVGGRGTHDAYGISGDQKCRNFAAIGGFGLLPGLPVLHLAGLERHPTVRT